MYSIFNTRRTAGCVSLAIVASVLASGISLGAKPSPKLAKAISYKPRQPNVVYEQISKDKVGDCSLEEKTRSDGKGFWITGAGGQPLRWFADTNRDNKLDRWCYYNAGVEVYRESDTDFNGTADEYRWLSTEGLRRGNDADEDGHIDSWTMISAAEVTAEVVAATARRDARQFERLLINNQEIQALGLGHEKAALLKQRVSDARSQFKTWAAGQNVITSKSKWTNFGADKPGIVPAGTDGSDKDVVVYENVVALLEDSGKPRQLLVGTMIRVRDSWRLVDLPRAVSEGVELSSATVFFSASFSKRGAGGSVPEATRGISKAMERLVTDLQETDEKLQQDGGNKAVLQSRRADVLEKLVSAAVGPDERTTWIHQFADTVSAAAQTNEYPGGAQRLNDFAKKLPTINATKDEIAYVVFRALTADYNQRMLNPKAKFEALQKEYLKNLEGYVRKYPKSDDSAEAMLQIALSSEFSGETKTAEFWYTKAKRSFGSTLSGRKAAGAIKRLNLENRRFELKSNTIDGRKFSSESYRGTPVIYHCWASWCDGCKAEMRGLKELQAKYAKSNLRIVGINFDNTREKCTEFLKKNSFPWVHLFDEGGLDSDLAISYGILTLPVNFVVDKSGKVVKTGVHWTELDGLIEDILK